MKWLIGIIAACSVFGAVALWFLCAMAAKADKALQQWLDGEF